MAGNTRIMVLALAGFAMVAVAGCGDDGSTGSSDGLSDESSAAAGQVEMSVADALAPYDAESRTLSGRSW